MKNVKALALVTALLCVAGSASFAETQPVPATWDEAPQQPKEIPLVVIRFNHPDVDYAKPLYETMTKVFQVKSSARFDVVSVSQKAGDPRTQKIYDDAAETNTDQVMNTLREMGMPRNRITLSHATESVHSNEVRIYVH